MESSILDLDNISIDSDAVPIRDISLGIRAHDHVRFRSLSCPGPAALFLGRVDNMPVSETTVSMRGGGDCIEVGRNPEEVDATQRKPISDLPLDANDNPKNSSGQTTIDQPGLKPPEPACLKPDLDRLPTRTVRPKSWLDSIPDVIDQADLTPATPPADRLSPPSSESGESLTPGDLALIGQHIHGKTPVNDNEQPLAGQVSAMNHANRSSARKHEEDRIMPSRVNTSAVYKSQNTVDPQPTLETENRTVSHHTTTPETATTSQDQNAKDPSQSVVNSVR
jgi:hypothetical protein